MLIAVIVSTLTIVALAPFVAVHLGMRNRPSDNADVNPGFDKVDYVWLQNTMAMPELEPHHTTTAYEYEHNERTPAWDSGTARTTEATTTETSTPIAPSGR